MERTNNIFLWLGAMLVSILLFSCKSEFEKIRTGGDTATMYEAGMKYYDAGEYLKAQTLFEQIISAYRGRKEAEQLFFKYAYTHYYLEQYILSAYYFKNFSETFSNSDYREEAMFMSAFSNYQLSPSFRLDQSNTTTAIDEFQLFVNTFPRSERVEECNRLIDQLRSKLEIKAIAQAQLYYDMQQYRAAVESFGMVLQDYPESKDAQNIAYKQVLAEHKLAKNSVYSKKAERFEKTVELADRFLNRYPESDFFQKVRDIKFDSNEELKSLIDG